MLAAIFRYVSSLGIPMSIACILWIVVFDDKAKERIKEPVLKRCIYAVIVGYFVTIVFGVLRIISRY